jgi:hypothetical protein
LGLALVVAAIAVATASGVAAERRWGGPAERSARRMLWTMLFVLAPPVVFFNVARLELDADVGAGVLLGWVALLVVAGLARAVVGRLRTERPMAGTVMVGSIQGNTGYLGYPLTAVLLGADRLPQAVAYDLLVTVPVLFTIGFGIGAAFGDSGGEGLADRLRAFLFRNPLMPAFLLGLAVPASVVPDALVTASRALVFAMLPAGFFAVGVHFAASLPEGRALAPPSRPLALGVALRLVAAPAILWLLARPLIDLPAPYLLLAAMPCGINVLLVANTYGLDRRLAAGMIAWSTALVLAAVAAATLAGA